MNKKLIALVLVFGLIFVTGCGKKSNDNKPIDDNNNPEVTGPTANTNESIISEQVIDGIKITNITLVAEGERTVFTADVVNTTENSIDVNSFNVIYKDSDGKELVNMFVYVGKTLEPNVVSSVSSNVEINLSNATSVEYVKN